MKNQVLSLLVENKPGVLARVIGVISAQGFNILTLTAAPAEPAELTGITVVVEMDDDARARWLLVRKLTRVVPVIDAIDVTEEPALGQEMLLAELQGNVRTSRPLMQTLEEYGARIADYAENGLELEVSGCPSRLDELVSRLGAYGRVSVARSGLVVLRRSTVPDGCLPLADDAAEYSSCV